MQNIIDHGANDPIAYDLSGTQDNMTHIRKHLPGDGFIGGISCTRAAEVLRNLDNARTGQQATAYTFDEVTAALRMGAAALEHLVA